MAATQRELREAIAGNALKMAGEPGQRGAIIRQLAALGYRRAPTISEGKLDGSSVRIYLWTGTPAGDLILVTGAAFHPRVIGPEDIQTVSKGIYILSGPDRTKASALSAKLAESYRVPKVRVAVEEAPRVRAPTPTVTATAARKVRAKLERVPTPPPAPVIDVQAAREAALMAKLQALLG